MFYDYRCKLAYKLGVALGFCMVIFFVLWGDDPYTAEKKVCEDYLWLFKSIDKILGIGG